MAKDEKPGVTTSSSNDKTKKSDIKGQTPTKRLRVRSQRLYRGLKAFYSGNYIPGDTYRYVFQKNLEVKRSYIYHKFSIFVAHTLILVWSLFNVLEPCPPDTRKEYTDCLSSRSRVYVGWPFYLTNFALFLNTLQSVIGLALTIRVYYVQKSSELRKVSPAFLQNKNEHKLTTATGIFWGLNTTCTVYGILIDVVYWGLIHNYKKPLVFNNLVGHFFNLVVLTIDKVVAAFPVLIAHSVILFITSIFFIAANATYFALGGLDKYKEQHHLYSFINWDKPLTSLLFCAFLLMFAELLLELIRIADTYKHKIFRPKQIYAANEDTIPGKGMQSKRNTKITSVGNVSIRTSQTQLKRKSVSPMPSQTNEVVQKSYSTEPGGQQIV